MLNPSLQPMIARMAARFRGILLATICLAGLLTGCAPASPTSIPPAAALNPTLTAVPPAASSETPGVTTTDEACPPTEAQAYLDVAYVLADEMAVDAKKAQALEALSSADLSALRQQAAVRADRLAQLQPPACLQPAHVQLSESFRLMQTSLRLIAESDIPAASQSLKDAYEALAQAAALISAVIY